MKAELWFVSMRVFLTAEETDRFFDPFDPADVDLPSHLYRRGHRFIKVFIYEWLQSNFGASESGAWSVDEYHDEDHVRCKAFIFENHNHAMLFMTIWGGKPVRDQETT